MSATATKTPSVPWTKTPPGSLSRVQGKAGLPGLAKMFASMDIAGIVAACATVIPVTDKPHKVGDVTTWGSVQPGTLVRFADDREALRWKVSDTYGDDVSRVEHGTRDIHKLYRYGDSSFAAKDAPCVVIGAGLSERMCAALNEAVDQPQRWAIANGYYGKASDASRGSVWTWPSGWGITLADGGVKWINADEVDADERETTLTRDELLALEARLEGCAPEIDEPWTYGLAHVELSGLTDSDLLNILSDHKPRSKLLDYVRVRNASPHAWLAEQVADWATFHIRPDVRSTIQARAHLCLRSLYHSQTSTFRPSVWPTLRALGLHIAKADTYLGWWGQTHAPTRASSATDLLFAYLANPPGYAECARAVLGSLPMNRTDVRLQSIHGESAIHQRACLHGTDYAMISQAEQVCVRLNELLHVKILAPYVKIIDNVNGVAVLTQVQADEATAKAPPVVDCGIQPVVLLPDHECDILVLWPYDSSNRGRRAFAAAAVAEIRQRQRVSSRMHSKKLRIEFA